MASFSDSIPSFAPYVQQLPVEAMVDVGLKRQAKYDEGIQKIQSQIDSVAGVDVIRDVDKSYLQSKLNQLNTDLRTVAAGDFSDFQLVNSVMGMTNQIVKDPNVQNAISSTAWYRKQRDQMQKDISEGKAGQSNIWDFQQKANAWLSSGDVQQGFKDVYQPKVDYQKQWNEVFKSLHSNLTSQDITGVMDKDGNIDHNKLSAAMTRVKDQGISVSQIENAIRSSLTPEVLNQLSLDGRYEYRGASPETLQEAVALRYKKTLSDLDAKISYMEQYASLNQSNTAEYNKAKQSLKDLQDRKAYQNSLLRDNLELARTNPDAVKANLYKEGAINSFANAYSWEEKTVEKMTNPELVANQWQQTHDLSERQFRLAQDKETFDKWYKEEMLKNDIIRTKLAVDKEKKGTQEFTTFFGNDTQIKPPAVALEKDIIDSRVKYDKFIKDYAKASGATEQSVLNQIEQFKKTGDISSILVNYRTAFKSAMEANSDADFKQKILDETRAKIESSEEFRGKQGQLNTQLLSKKPIDINIDGKTVHFSQREIYDYLAKEKISTENKTGASPIRMGPPGYVWDTTPTVDPAYLSPKERLLYESVKSIRYREPSNLSFPAMADILNSYQAVKDSSAKYQEELSKKLSDEIGTVHENYIPSVTLLDTTEPKLRIGMEGTVGNLLLKYNEPEGTPGGSETLTSSKRKLANNWLKEAPEERNKISYSKVVQGSSKWIMMKKGEETVLIPLTERESKQYTGDVSVEPSSQEQRIEERFKFNNLKTEEDFFKPFNFENAEKLPVYGSLSQDSEADGYTYLSLHLILPSGEKVYTTWDKPLNVDFITQHVPLWSKEQIKEIFLKDPHITLSQKEEIKNM